MTPDKTCAQLAAETDRKVRAFKKEAKEVITRLPDAPGGVQLLSRNCAVVRYSALVHDILSPTYYLNRSVKLRLISVINQTDSITVLDKRIRGLLDTGWLEDTHKNRDRVPESFLVALGKLWLGEENFNVYAKTNPKIYPSFKD